MARGQIWQNFPKLLRFMALFPSLLWLLWRVSKEAKTEVLVETFRNKTFHNKIREGANREKLTVKKIINNEMFFSPFMSLINREKLCVNREKSAPKIHHFFAVSFHRLRPHEKFWSVYGKGGFTVVHKNLTYIKRKVANSFLARLQLQLHNTCSREISFMCL